MKFSVEQQLAINASGKNVVVSASAGAGKTRVLIARLVKRITEDHIPLNRIIAMTFTEAAANEMKQRLAIELNRLHDENPNDTYISEQLTLLADANISTIHSFCLSLIKKYYSVIEIDPQSVSNILSEGLINNLKDEAFDISLKQLIETNPGAATSLLNYFSSRSEDTDSLKDIVIKIVNTAHSCFDEDKWYQSAIDHSKPIKSFNDFEGGIINTFYERLCFEVDDLESRLLVLKRLVATKYADELDLAQSIETKISGLKPLKQAIIDKNYDEFINRYQSFCLLPITNFKSAPDADKKLRTNISDKAKEYFKHYYRPEAFVLMHNKMSEVLMTLLSLSQETSKTFSSLKQAHQGIDFDDMEHYAYKILTTNDCLISKELSNQFDEIMVDEFQDTNEIQNQIIELISNGHNVFRVGDVKQSIYRFRKAKPDIMRSLMNDTNQDTIYLSNNYRSKESIINFTNDLFGKLMNIDGINDQYIKEDIVGAGTDEQKANDQEKITFFAIKHTEINKPRDEDEEENNQDTESLATKQLKAAFIAKHLKQLHDSGTYPKYNDFVILVRSHNEKYDLKQAFEHYGIPYDIDTKEGFYKSPLALTMLSICRYILDNTDEISLLSVLTSSLTDLTDNDIAQLKIKYGTIYKGLIETKHPIINSLQDLNDTYDLEGIVAMLTKAAAINDFYLEKLSEQQRTNFDLLMEKAIQFEKQNNSLYDFIKEIEANYETKSSEAVAIGEDDDVVRVVTIHQSKGLQYPVVYFWSSSKNNFLDSKDSVLCDSELGIGYNYLKQPSRIKKPSLERLAIENKLSQEDVEEYTRVLYVALTRAQERLYIVDTVGKEYEPTTMTKSLLRARKGTTNLILNALDTTKNFNVEYVDEFEPLPTSTFIHKAQPSINKLSPITSQNISIISPSNHDFIVGNTLNVYKQNKGATHGSLIHNIIESLPNTLWTADDLSTLELSEEDKMAILKFGSSDIYKACIDKNMRIEKELPFIYRKDNQIINGTMDFVAHNDSEVILIDFKTDQSIDEQYYIDSYTEQLTLYCQSLRVIYSQSAITAYVYSFTLNKFIEIKPEI